MRYTNQIRRYFSLAAAAGISACMLFGCTRADIASSSPGASAANSSVSQSTVTGMAPDAALAGAGAQQALPQSSAQQNPGEASQSREAQQAVGQTAQNVSGTTTAAQAPAPDTQSQAQAGTTPDTASAAQEQVPVQEPVQVQEQPGQSAQTPSAPAVGMASESFNGEFEKSDGEENVVISLVNDSTISFQFAVSSIGAMAQAGGSTAVYYGDDGYSITFDVAGDALAVTVGGEDGAMSAMNGIYYRVLDGGDNAEEDDLQEEIYDADADEIQEIPDAASGDPSVMPEPAVMEEGIEAGAPEGVYETQETGETNALVQ